MFTRMANRIIFYVGASASALFLYYSIRLSGRNVEDSLKIVTEKNSGYIFAAAFLAVITLIISFFSAQFAIGALIGWVLSSYVENRTAFNIAFAIALKSKEKSGKVAN